MFFRATIGAKVILEKTFGYKFLASPCQTTCLTRRGLQSIVCSPFLNCREKQSFLHNYTHIPVRLCHEKSEKHIHGKHFVPVIHPEKGRLVYSGDLGNQLKRLKRFSLGSSFLTLCFQPPLLLANETIAFKAGIAVGLSFFTFFVPFLIHMLVKRYILYMYFNDETKTFTATRFTFFLGHTDIVFKADDICIDNNASMFTFFHVKGKPLFLNCEEFKDTRVYVHMMGYDKDIDLGFLKENDPESLKQDLGDRYKAIDLSKLGEKDIAKKENSNSRTSETDGSHNKREDVEIKKKESM